MTKKYTVRFVRDEDGWWVATVAGVKGVHAQGRSIGQARDRAREALAAAIGEKEAAAVELVTQIGGVDKTILRHVLEVKRVQRKAEKTQARAAELARRVARQLVKEKNMSVRDAGEIMGITGGRVQQLVQKH